MIRFPFVAGFAPVHHLKLIGADPRFQALRERNAARLAALKASKQLHEDKQKNGSASTGHPAQPSDPEALQRYYNQLAAAQQSGNPYGGQQFTAGLSGLSAFLDDEWFGGPRI